MNGKAGLPTHHAVPAAQEEPKLTPGFAMEDQAALEWILKLWPAIQKLAKLVVTIVLTFGIVFKVLELFVLIQKLCMAITTFATLL